MEFEDRLRIATAEGVDLDVVLAGLGSRFIALLVDLVLQTVLILALGLGLSRLGNLGAAAYALLAFVVSFGYHVLFEVLGGGRTPGKRLAGLRVVDDHAGPVAFVPSAVRNIVRVIDILPGIYAVGMVAILVSDRNQRLGDLAAGTLVIRDRLAVPGHSPIHAFAGAALPPDAAAWDLSAVTGEDVATVRAFLTRRDQLTPDARHQLAVDLATRLSGRVVGPPVDRGPEHFLEQLVSAKDAR